jgi:cyclopropane fatty-acyl-phospholipid synthase-like methyltransferase
MIFKDDSDRSFQKFGQRCPYWAVLTQDEYRSKEIGPEAWDQFFLSGQQHVASVLRLLDKHFPTFNPRRALDFGCGVGRILIPLAARFQEVVGIDISSEMLAEARTNCSKKGISNAQLLLSDDDLSLVTGQFDLIHSFIVLQHIPPNRGIKLIKRLLDCLAPNGIAALHFTFDRDTSWIRKAISGMRKNFLPFHYLLNVVQKKQWDEPILQMNHYNLKEVFRILADKKIHSIHSEMTCHGGHLGLFLFFQNRDQEGYF